MFLCRFHLSKQIKTFTYEIPNDTKVPTNKNFSYKNEFYNSMNSSNTYYPERDVPPPTKTTTMYSNESHNSLNRTENVYPPNPPQPDTLGPNQTYFYKKEVNETKNNVYGSPRSPRSPPSPVNTTTSLYERNVTNNRNVYHPPGGIPVYPNNANLPPHQPGTKQTYLYKKETTNTTNTAFEPTNGKEYLPHDRYITEPPPADPVTNKYYKYSSTSTTKNTHNRPEREPLLAPFPTDGLHSPTQVDGPPKHLGQLMASFDEVGIICDIYIHTKTKTHINGILKGFHILSVHFTVDQSTFYIVTYRLFIFVAKQSVHCIFERTIRCS